MSSIEEGRKCCVEGCMRPTRRSYGMCTAHICRKRKYGDPLGGGRHYEMHGMKNTPEYRAWRYMKGRCLNPKNTRYEDYGGRGIEISAEWVGSFMAFYGHIGPKPTPQHSLDRVDNGKGYEPGNVRWATPFEQSNNRRKRRYYAKP